MEIDNINGYIYLLHYKDKMSHAQHYVGWTNDIENRIFEHIEGKQDKCKLTYEFAKRNIPFVISKLWYGTRNDERAIKKHKSQPKHCTCCKGNDNSMPTELKHIMNDLNRWVLLPRYN